MVQFFDKGLKTVLICFFLLAGITSCKDDYSSVVPYVPVYLDINIANHIELNTELGYFKLKGGYGGIIIFHDVSGNSNPFLAYDATCTYDLPSIYSVETDGSGIATCPHCKSQYILIGGNGAPITGPAIEPLLQYQTSFFGGLISVRN